MIQKEPAPGRRNLIFMLVAAALALAATWNAKNRFEKSRRAEAAQKESAIQLYSAFALEARHLSSVAGEIVAIHKSHSPREIAEIERLSLAVLSRAIDRLQQFDTGATRPADAKLVAAIEAWKSATQALLEAWRTWIQTGAKEDSEKMENLKPNTLAAAREIRIQMLRIAPELTAKLAPKLETPLNQ